MITGELRNKIDRLWETFWTGGITNPLDVVEQMTYLMFIHDLDETDNLRSKESAMLGLPYTTDVRGDIYEYLLSKLSTAGVNGQFRTPRHIIRMMVELTDPKAEDVICDIKALRLIQFNYSSADFAA